MSYPMEHTVKSASLYEVKRYQTKSAGHLRYFTVPYQKKKKSYSYNKNSIKLDFCTYIIIVNSTQRFDKEYVL